MIDEITPQELAAKLAKEGLQILDVREQWERDLCHLPESIHIVMAEVPGRLGELDPACPVAVLCHHGMRSMQVALFLADSGFQAVANITGGIDRWATDVDPSLARY
ncbi:MAG: sulfurtransferase [Gammaproteobacteria bacterium]|nr:sulfurtransferase [Gammaproteobacteria bacterium]NNL99910.1 sulfurtransferase [Gammaproteobacteria bacterium]